MVPHGIYPSAGEDQWVAIACRDDADWQAFAGAARPATTSPTSPSSSAATGASSSTLWWRRGRPARTAVAAATLVGLGVPAHAVQNSGECASDEQLAAQHHFVAVPHAHHGTVVIEASRIGLSATPATVRRGPPVLGEHTVEVLTELLGYDDERLGELFAAGGPRLAHGQLTRRLTFGSSRRGRTPAVRRRSRFMGPAHRG